MRWWSASSAIACRKPIARPVSFSTAFRAPCAQAEALRTPPSGLGKELDAVLSLEVDIEALVERLTGRRTCRECGRGYHVKFDPPRQAGICDACGGELFQRDDDQEETIRKRLEVYQEQTSPLVDYYRKHDLLIAVDGMQEIGSGPAADCSRRCRRPEVIVIKSAAELDRMRVAGRIVGEILALLRERIVPGVTTAELDRLAESECRKRKVKPAFKGYGGFPYTICASPNDKVVHGFPDETPLREGDILSIDFGVVYDGFYGDAAFTVAGGTDRSEASAAAGRHRTLPGAGDRRRRSRRPTFRHLPRRAGLCRGRRVFGVFASLSATASAGQLHESPQIPNFGPPGQGPLLKPGMTLAIEPMINAGGPGVKVLGDGWTAVTVDDRLSCHFEHTVAVTDNGPEILTLI